MLPRPPQANVLNRLLWLGTTGRDDAVPVGSGVIVFLNDNEYLVTAMHVAEVCEFRPLVRFRGQWNRMKSRIARATEAASRSLGFTPGSR